MTTTNIITALSRKNNGQFFKIRWGSEVPLKAAAKRENHLCMKVTETTVRKGITYGNQKRVIAKVEAGELPEKHELPWGQWHPDYKGLIIQHKGNDYLRLYMGPNKSKIQYYLDGKLISYEELKASGLVQESYFNKRSEVPDALTLKVENIQQIF